MTNKTNYTYSADFILGIPVTEPERIFPSSPEGIKLLYLELVKSWHPDRCNDPKAVEVVQHVAELRTAAIKKLASGLWQTPQKVEITTVHGKKFQFLYYSKYEFELGMMYVGRTHILFAVHKEHKTLFENGVSTMNFTYGSVQMRQEMEKYLPNIKWQGVGTNYYYLVLTKTADVVLLRDLHTYYNGTIPPKHVAWIISSILNIGCYLSWAKLTHNNISLDTVFVSPKNHMVLLLGGWWYAVAEGTSLRGRTLPQRSVTLMSTQQLRDRTASVQLDQDLIRAMGRELLGDALGTRLSASTELPQEIISWVKTTSTKGALESYQQWRTVLKTSFGKPKFVKMEITPDQIYKGA